MEQQQMLANDRWDLIRRLKGVTVRVNAASLSLQRLTSVDISIYVYIQN
jgi:hypothetical protein